MIPRRQDGRQAAERPVWPTSVVLGLLRRPRLRLGRRMRLRASATRSSRYAGSDRCRRRVRHWHRSLAEAAYGAATGSGLPAPASGVGAKHAEKRPTDAGPAWHASPLPRQEDARHHRSRRRLRGRTPRIASPHARRGRLSPWLNLRRCGPCPALPAPVQARSTATRGSRRGDACRLAPACRRASRHERCFAPTIPRTCARRGPREASGARTHHQAGPPECEAPELRTLVRHYTIGFEVRAAAHRRDPCSGVQRPRCGAAVTERSTRHARHIADPTPHARLPTPQGVDECARSTAARRAGFKPAPTETPRQGSAIQRTILRRTRSFEAAWAIGHALFTGRRGRSRMHQSTS